MRERRKAARREAARREKKREAWSDTPDVAMAEWLAPFVQRLAEGCYRTPARRNE